MTPPSSTAAPVERETCAGGLAPSSATGAATHCVLIVGGPLLALTIVALPSLVSGLLAVLVLLVIAGTVASNLPLREVRS